MSNPILVENAFYALGYEQSRVDYRRGNKRWEMWDEPGYYAMGYRRGWERMDRIAQEEELYYHG